MKLDNNAKNKTKKILYSIFIGRTITRKIFMFYLYVITLGIIFLSLPISLRINNQALLNDGSIRDYKFIDAFFTSISAFTDTGLSTLNIVGTYNIFGQFVILVLIQLGGLGLFTIYWMVWNLLFNNIIYKKIKRLPLHEGRTMSFSNSMLIASERGNTKLGLSMKTIKSALIFILISELIFTVIYSLMFYFIPSYVQSDLAATLVGSNGSNPLELNTWYVDTDQYNHFYRNAGLSIWTGLFQSISTMNNAGFDVIGQASYSTFRNGVWTIFLYISIIQIVIGGIGYPVIYDLTQYFKYKHHRQKFKFSLFTKVSTITYFLVTIMGMAFLFGFEYGINDGSLISQVNSNDLLKFEYFGKDKSLVLWNQITSLIFNVFSSRSSGMSTFSQSSMSFASIWIINILMFIGCAPSSTGGGIRTTTLAIMCMTTWSYMKGEKHTVIFKKVVPSYTVKQSAVIILISLTLIACFSMITYPIALNVDQNHSLTITDIFFEFASSYGTVGLSTGLSSILDGSSVGTYFISIMLCIIMVIGQLGVGTTLLAFKSKDTNKAIQYATEDIRI